MRIICMGTPEFSIPTFEALHKAGHEIVAVVTMPDKPAGRGKKLRSSPVKVYAEEQGFDVLQPVKLRDPEFIARLHELKPDLAVVVAFRMLPEMVWSIPKVGTINLHAALLPDYRGAAPINWVIINGEKETGVTTFFIDHKIDTGETLLQRHMDIPEDWNAGDLHDAMMVLGAEVVRDTVAQLEAGPLEAKPQDHSKFEHPAPKIFKEDCVINWDQSSEKVYNFIRGLSPYPAAHTVMDDLMLKVLSVRKLDDKPFGNPGSTQPSDSALLVCTSDGVLAIEELQLQGKKRMHAGDFLRGYKGDCVIN